MNNLMQIVENEQTSEFYPTPQALAQKMLAGVEWKYIHTILEPSAGKGDILREIAPKEHSYRYECSNLDVDCIEIDPNLRQILKYNFSDERKSIVRKRDSELEPERRWNEDTRRYETIELTESQKIEKQRVIEELETFFHNGIHIVHDNFLTYTPFKHYDLIVMNPPFSNGDKHLLKALKMQEKGGNIICLLNAETIRNPYTETRKELVRLLNKHNAIIEFIEDAFVSAERRTGVEVALIKVAIEQVQEESDIYNRLKEAEEMEDFFDPNVTDLEVTDYIKAAVNQFKIEVKAGLELIRQYRALKPFMLRSFEMKEVRNADGTITKEYACTEPILRLTNTYERSYNDIHINDYLKEVRLKYWKALFSNKEFTGKLTSKLQSEWWEKIGRLKDYDFTEFNIATIHAEMNAQIKTGIEKEIIAMFDRLTEAHHWYPECEKNRHYFDGWATNKAHKIGKKVIIPCYGVFDSWDGKPRTYEAYKTLADIERILNFLDGNMTADVNSESFIKYNFERGITKNIQQKFYTVTFYKKGTVHITFTCPELIERFNIYAAQNKGWLPPNYGKAKYKDMTAEEKAVVDSFQGEEAYNEVMAKASYYLAPVTNNQLLMLGGAE